MAKSLNKHIRTYSSYGELTPWVAKHLLQAAKCCSRRISQKLMRLISDRAERMEEGNKVEEMGGWEQISARVSLLCPLRAVSYQ